MSYPNTLLNGKDVVIGRMFDCQKEEKNLKEGDTRPYVPLEVIREDRISFPLSGRNLSVKQASAEDFLAFISGAVHVVNIKEWSIFMRWNAITTGLEAGTLRVSQEGNTYTLALVKQSETEDFSSNNPASEAM